MAASSQHFAETTLKQLETDLSRMAGLVEAQFQGAIASFERRDVLSAEALIENDEKIDILDRDIEIAALDALASQSHDIKMVREIAIIMKLSGELERVGDLAKNVAKRTLVVSREAPASPTLGVVRMGRASLRQLSDILDAYATRNLDAAMAVWGSDDELDELYNSVFQEILAAMMIDPKSINACTHLVFIAKNFERVGDHATNIAEAIHFAETGTPLINARPKGDETSAITVPPPKQAGVS